MEARKKLIEEKKREKQEEQHAREKIRLRLEEDRKERRRKLGLSEELTEDEKAVLEEKRCVAVGPLAGVHPLLCRNFASPPILSEKAVPVTRACFVVYRNIFLVLA